MLLPVRPVVKCCAFLTGDPLPISIHKLCVVKDRHQHSTSNYCMYLLLGLLKFCVSIPRKPIHVDFITPHQGGCQNATADNCFSLIGPQWCNAVLDGPANSIVDLHVWHQRGFNLNKPRVLKHL